MLQKENLALTRKENGKGESRIIHEAPLRVAARVLNFACMGQSLREKKRGAVFWTLKKRKGGASDLLTESKN